jgi:Flp pilus assembly protein TadD
MMTTNDSRRLIPALCTAVLLTGCVTVPEQPAAETGEMLRHKNMDVMFATEFPVASIEEALEIAAQSLAAGEVDRALFFYVRALQFDPANVRLLTHIGDIHMRRGDNAMAKRAFLNAIKHDQEFAPALEALGMIYMDEGRNEEATAALRLAIKVDDERWRAHNALGIYADKEGDHPTALAHYTNALTINPDAAHVLSNIGYSRFLAGDIEGATTDLYSAAYDKGFERAWGNLAMVYASQGLYEDAVAAFREVMSDANAYNATGSIAMQNGDLQHAYSLLSEAVRKSSTYFPEAEDNLMRLKANGVTSAPLPVANVRWSSTNE